VQTLLPVTAPLAVAFADPIPLVSSEKQQNTIDSE